MAPMTRRPDDDAPVPGVTRSGPAQAATLLRQQAEKQALQATAHLREEEGALSPEAMRRTLHELHVHQIELEMQNEELRRIQVELEAARLRYFDLYDLAPLGYCSVSAQGLILQANLAASTMLGLPRTALTKQPISAVIYKADQDIYYLCRKQIITTGEPQACELRMVKSDGIPFWVHLAVSAAADFENETVTRVVMTDIDQNKAMQAAMAQREARYRAMVEWSPEAVTVHREGNIIYANAAALKLFGITRAQDLIGRPVLERIRPDFHSIVQARMLGMVHDKGATPMAELVMLKVDGTPIEVEVQSIWTLFDGAPAIQSAMHDVSERVRLSKLLLARNKELQIAKAAADSANRAKSDFLSGMSHELRTPLGTILGYAQLIQSGTPPPSPSQKRSIDQILRAGWYLLELVNEVLDLATVESGKLALTLEAVSLESVMQECQSMVAPLAEKRGIGLHFPRIDAPVFVHADRIRVMQVLINLLSNAIKYNKTGGTVTMTCLADVPERIRVCITDTGQGLAPEALAQLFQPFNRLGQQRSAEEGTGIGLMMCKRLVELMGGAIGVTSTLGEGSTFWIDMNRATDPAPP